MNRRQFMKELSRHLYWRMPPVETASVLRDYNEHFDSGLADGSSEEELLVRCGTPREIATELGQPGYRERTLLCLAALAALLLAAVGAHRWLPWVDVPFFGRNQLAALLVACAAVFSYVYILHGGLGVRPLRWVTLCAWLLPVVSFLPSLLCCLLFSMDFNAMVAFLSPLLEIQQIGSFATLILNIQMLMAIGSWVIIVLLRHRLDKTASVALALDAVSVSLSTNLRYLLSSMDDLATLPGAVRNLLLTSCCLLLMVIPFAVVARKERLWTRK